MTSFDVQLIYFKLCPEGDLFAKSALTWVFSEYKKITHKSEWLQRLANLIYIIPRFSPWFSFLENQWYSLRTPKYKNAVISTVWSYLKLRKNAKMGGQGIEPWTHGLRVRCSASWASHPKLNLIILAWLYELFKGNFTKISKLPKI